MPPRGATGPLLAVLLVLAAVFAGPAGAAPRKPSFRIKPCPQGVFPSDVEVECGTIAVPERRARPGGRKIRVAAAVVHAPSRRPRPDPIVFLDGGPSFGAISTFALDRVLESDPRFSYFLGAPYVKDRDLILVDTRGTGSSRPRLGRPRLGCPEFARAEESAFFSEPFVDSSFAKEMRAALKACRKRLSGRGIHLAAYNSAEGAADLNALRRALGYRRWNVLAFSADGVLGLTYMRLYPKRIRSAILDSPQSPQFLHDLDQRRGIHALLERVFAGCAANAACNDRYPDIRAVFYDLVHALQANPQVVSVTVNQLLRDVPDIPPVTPRPVRVKVDGLQFYLASTDGLRPGDRFFPGTIHDTLKNIWRSAHGELEAVYREQLGGEPVGFNDDSPFAEGKTASYECRDVIGFITRRDIRQAALEIPELAPYFLDPDYGLPIGPAGCRIWRVGRADAVQHRPVSSRIPTLVLAGEYDTAVPPLITRQIPPTLRNSFFYEFPGVDHAQLAYFNPATACARSIAAQFLRHPRRRPDSSCVATVPPFDFTPPPSE